MFSSISRVAAPFRAVAKRFSSSQSGSQELKARFAELLPPFQAKVKKLRQEHGNKVLGNCTIDMAYGGMRDVKSMVYETSLLDAQEGIRFRGLSIPECQEQLPKFPGGSEPQPEGIFWLMLTGEVPTEAQVRALSADWAARAQLPAAAEKIIASLPKSYHPMTQLSMAILALQSDSKFAEAYQKGVNKTKLWEFAFEDTMNLIARLPRVAAMIYRQTYADGKVVADDASLDWSGNFANMLGYKDKQFQELMRLYLTIHSDHEGGNVSAHTTHLVGSALSDPYLSLSAGMNGLAGPLHGLANQEVLRFLKDIKVKLAGKPATPENLTEVCWSILNGGQVIPGYGHAVLRKTDPRYTCQREFALKHIPNDEMFQMVSTLYSIVPGILTKQGKTKNPWPNVDAHSGVLLTALGMHEENYYTVLFGVSRALGVLSNLIWARAMGLPIERPKSLTTEWIEKFVAGTAQED